MNNIEIIKSLYKEAFIRKSHSFTHYTFGDYKDELAHTEFYNNGKFSKIILFDGTDDEKEWASNFKFRTNNLGFHTGFCSTYLSCLPYCIQDIISKIKEYEVVYFGGYSRGGPLACFLAEFIARTKKAKCIVVTFGGARFSKKKNLDYFKNVDIINVENTGDIVPRLLRFKYKKPGKVVKIKKGNLFQIWRYGKNHEYF